MAELPILPLKTDALLGDTAHMSPEQFGAYCRILFTMWRHGSRLKDDEVELARIAGLSLRRWRTVSEAILRPMTAAGGMISQKRLTTTYLDVQELRKKRALAATEQHARRRGADAGAGALHQQCTTTANQNQTKSLSFLPGGTVDSGYVPAKQLPLPRLGIGEVKQRGNR